MADWYADAAFAVHVDMKSHTGCVLAMGKWVIKMISMKQKINTKISTEAKLVAANDALSHLLWTNNFLKQQRYNYDTTLH